jgi:Asp-tRNA(Asn)/Glu-tRNA(Gln) amidotransferase A subunit family amidase
MSGEPYDPRAPGLLTFHDAVRDFRDGPGTGADTPVKYLERCLARITAREPAVKAFTSANLDAAMAAAEAATKRYRDGCPASPIDGMPLGLKDVFETRDAPTGWGARALSKIPGRRDAAIVHALRTGGGILVGKTALPELGFGPPATTTNPWDAARTPGGSSSGSAAAVGAAMVPAAIGTQGKGSLTRPASFCGIYGFKPGHATIHRGGDGGSQATNTHVGVLAGGLEDAWITARFLSHAAGPHPGGQAITGPADLPAPAKPKVLVRMEAAGWARTEEPAKAAYEALLESIGNSGVAVAHAGDDPQWAALEDEQAAAAAALSAIADYESRWPLFMYLERDREEGGGVFDALTHERGRARRDVTREDYEQALIYRAQYRERLAAVQKDGVFPVTPSATGAAPQGLADTGSAVYQGASSLAGNPVVSLPFMEASAMPLGLQVQGFVGGEAKMIAAARWLDQAFHAGEI